MESPWKRSDVIRGIGKVLVDVNRPMKERFRALFTLRNIGGELSIKCIEKCFRDNSALLKHECAYCLGQMRDPSAVPILVSLLEDSTEEPIVRHEAAEALAAIGLDDSLEVLRRFLDDPITEVAETCELSVRMIELRNCHEEDISKNPYNTMDPAPPLPSSKPHSVNELKHILLDQSEPLFHRYRAMFSLRNMGTNEAALAIAEGLYCGSSIFRHEIAFVLGQIQNVMTVEQLARSLSDQMEHEMVRHECAEALGAIATEKCMQILKDFLNDDKPVVRESCEVALDMCDYENSQEFQYANMLNAIEC